MIRTWARILWLRHFHVCTEWDEDGLCVVCLEPGPLRRPTLEDEMAAYYEEDEPDGRE